MTDREKLIKLMIEAKKADTKEIPFFDFLADQLIANGVTVQEWIPVSERPPEDDERIEFYDDGRMRCTTVFAYTEHGRTIPKNRLLVRPVGNKYLDGQATDGWIWSSGTEEVTHWMPLPEPPKEDKT